jgi:hypothetical protein
MRLRWLFPFPVCLAAIAIAADEPAPLLKPVVPGPNRVRARFATHEGKIGFMHLEGRVAVAKGNREDYAEVRVAFEIRPGRAVVAAKAWQRWGYAVPANKIGILPQLVLPCVQVAPKPAGDRAAEVRFAGIRVEVVEPPGDAETVLGCDLLVSLSDLTRQSDRLYEPRLHLGERFLELTVPAGSVRRTEAGGDAPAEPVVNPDPKLVPAMATTARRGPAVLSYSALNGHARYRTADGKEVPVNMTVSSTTRAPGGVIVSLGVARGCGIEIEQGKEIAGSGTSFQTSMARAKVEELRIGLMTGTGYGTPRDLVLKDVTVWVDKHDSGHMVWLGPEFLRAHFKDSVYACDSDGVWKFLGRVRPEDTRDVKTRPKKP